MTQNTENNNIDPTINAAEVEQVIASLEQDRDVACAQAADIDVQDIAFREVPVDPKPAKTHELALVIGGLVEELKKAGHPDPEMWISSLENPSEGSQTDAKAGIFLVNRAIRLLITERRDIPEADRSGSLLTIVDATDIPSWINMLKQLVVPVMVKYNVGVPGLVKADENAQSAAQQEAAMVLSSEENAAQAMADKVE